MVYVIEKGFNLYPNLFVKGLLYCKDCGLEVLEATIPHYLEDNRLFNKLPYDYALKSDELMQYPTLREEDIVIEISIVKHELVLRAMSYCQKELYGFFNRIEKNVFSSISREFESIMSFKDCEDLTVFYLNVVAKNGIPLREFLNEIKSCTVK